MILFGHEDMLKPASHYLQMSWVIVLMRHCRLCYIFFFGTLLLIGFDIPSCEYIKLMMASGMPLISLAVLLAMVGASDTRVAEKLVEQQAFEFLLILSTCSWCIPRIWLSTSDPDGLPLGCCSYSSTSVNVPCASNYGRSISLFLTEAFIADAHLL